MQISSGSGSMDTKAVKNRDSEQRRSRFQRIVAYTSRAKEKGTLMWTLDADRKVALYNCTQRLDQLVKVLH